MLNMLNMMNTRIRGLSMLAVASSMSLSLVGCGAVEEHPAEPAAPVAVRVATLAAHTAPTMHDVVGTTRAIETAVVAARVMSQIAAVHVQAGDAVRAGQLLVELDDRYLASALRAAEAARAGVDAAVLEAGYALEAARADLGLAETTHERFADLLERRSVSRQEYDEVAARLQGARASVQMAEARGRMAASSGVQMDAQLDAARAAVSYARLIAPMDGIVTARHVDAGSLASPGVPLLTLERVGALELEVSPPASLLSVVTVGQMVPVIFDGPVETTGEIIEIVPTVDPASRTFTLTVRFRPSPDCGPVCSAGRGWPVRRVNGSPCLPPRSSSAARCRRSSLSRRALPGASSCPSAG